VLRFSGGIAPRSVATLKDSNTRALWDALADRTFGEAGDRAIAKATASLELGATRDQKCPNAPLDPSRAWNLLLAFARRVESEHAIVALRASDGVVHEARLVNTARNDLVHRADDAARLLALPWVAGFAVCSDPSPAVLQLGIRGRAPSSLALHNRLESLPAAFRDAGRVGPGADSAELERALLSDSFVSKLANKVASRLASKRQREEEEEQKQQPPRAREEDTARERTDESAELLDRLRALQATLCS
jgi:hypothetical protein